MEAPKDLSRLSSLEIEEYYQKQLAWSKVRDNISRESWARHAIGDFDGNYSESWEKTRLDSMNRMIASWELDRIGKARR